MEKSLISVIIPIYKVEKYLNKCVESVTSQTYTNLEIILVDDGSPDNCGKMCDEYARADDRITVIHKKNGGLSDARNVGIDAATGEYIMFIDSDDYIARDMCEKLHNVLAKNSADMSICNFLCVDEYGNKVLNNTNLPILDEVTDGMTVLTEKMLDRKSWYWVIAWNKLYKKELFQDVRYPVGRQHEDEYVIHKLMLKCGKIAGVSEPLYYYVQRGDSIMGKGFDIKTLDAVEAIFLRIKDLNALQIEAQSVYPVLITAIKNMYCSLKGADYRQKENRLRYYEVYKIYRDIIAGLIKGNLSLREKIVLILNYIVMYFAPKGAAIIPLHKIFDNRRKPK